MSKTILLTGATDGIGFETARILVGGGHSVFLHGRNPIKLEAAKSKLDGLPNAGPIETYVADLSDLEQTARLATDISARHQSLDVIINNAGVFRTGAPIAPNGLDVRFVVNTLAPYVLTRRLLPLMGTQARIVNVSSAAQASISIEAMEGRATLSDNAAYAQSKLAITMWSQHMAEEVKGSGPEIYAVNPASFLGSKMVKDAYGIDGGDLQIGADILVRAALSDEFFGRSGQYYDNDSKQFAPPHADASRPVIVERVLDSIVRLTGNYLA